MTSTSPADTSSSDAPSLSCLLPPFHAVSHAPWLLRLYSTMKQRVDMWEHAQLHEQIREKIWRGSVKQRPPHDEQPNNNNHHNNTHHKLSVPHTLSPVPVPASSSPSTTGQSPPKVTSPTNRTASPPPVISPSSSSSSSLSSLHNTAHNRHKSHDIHKYMIHHAHLSSSSASLSSPTLPRIASHAHTPSASINTLSPLPLPVKFPPSPSKKAQLNSAEIEKDNPYVLQVENPHNFHQLLSDKSHHPTSDVQRILSLSCTSPSNAHQRMTSLCRNNSRVISRDTSLLHAQHDEKQHVHDEKHAPLQRSISTSSSSPALLQVKRPHLSAIPSSTQSHDEHTQHNNDRSNTTPSPSPSPSPSSSSPPPHSSSTSSSMSPTGDLSPRSILEKDLLLFRDIYTHYMTNETRVKQRRDQILQDMRHKKHEQDAQHVADLRSHLISSISRTLSLHHWTQSEAIARGINRAKERVGHRKKVELLKKIKTALQCGQQPVELSIIYLQIQKQQFELEKSRFLLYADGASNELLPPTRVERLKQEYAHGKSINILRQPLYDPTPQVAEWAAIENKKISKYQQRQSPVKRNSPIKSLQHSQSHKQLSASSSLSHTHTHDELQPLVEDEDFNTRTTGSELKVLKLRNPLNKYERMEKQIEKEMVELERKKLKLQQADDEYSETSSPSISHRTLNHKSSSKKLLPLQQSLSSSFSSFSHHLTVSDLLSILDSSNLSNSMSFHESNHFVIKYLRTLIKQGKIDHKPVNEVLKRMREQQIKHDEIMNNQRSNSTSPSQLSASFNDSNSGAAISPIRIASPLTLHVDTTNPAEASQSEAHTHANDSLMSPSDTFTFPSSPQSIRSPTYRNQIDVILQSIEEQHEALWRESQEKQRQLRERTDEERLRFIEEEKSFEAEKFEKLNARLNIDDASKTNASLNPIQSQKRMPLAPLQTRVMSTSSSAPQLHTTASFPKHPIQNGKDVMLQYLVKEVSLKKEIESFKEREKSERIRQAKLHQQQQQLSAQDNSTLGAPSRSPSSSPKRRRKKKRKSKSKPVVTQLPAVKLPPPRPLSSSKLYLQRNVGTIIDAPQKEKDKDNSYVSPTFLFAKSGHADGTYRPVQLSVEKKDDSTFLKKQNEEVDAELQALVPLYEDDGVFYVEPPTLSQLPPDDAEAIHVRSSISPIRMYAEQQFSPIQQHDDIDEQYHPHHHEHDEKHQSDDHHQHSHHHEHHDNEHHLAHDANHVGASISPPPVDNSSLDTSFSTSYPHASRKSVSFSPVPFSGDTSLPHNDDARNAAATPAPRRMSWSTLLTSPPTSSLVSEFHAHMLHKNMSKENEMEVIAEVDEEPIGDPLHSHILRNMRRAQREGKYEEVLSPNTLEIIKNELVPPLPELLAQTHTTSSAATKKAAARSHSPLNTIGDERANNLSPTPSRINLSPFRGSPTFSTISSSSSASSVLPFLSPRQTRRLLSSLSTSALKLQSNPDDYRKQLSSKQATEAMRQLGINKGASHSLANLLSSSSTLDEWEAVYQIYHNKRKSSKTQTQQPLLPFLLWVPSYHRLNLLRAVMSPSSSLPSSVPLPADHVHRAKQLWNRIKPTGMTMEEAWKETMKQVHEEREMYERQQQALHDEMIKAIEGRITPADFDPNVDVRTPSPFLHASSSSHVLSSTGESASDITRASESSNANSSSLSNSHSHVKLVGVNVKLREQTLNFPRQLTLFERIAAHEKELERMHEEEEEEIDEQDEDRDLFPSSDSPRITFSSSPDSIHPLSPHDASQADITLPITPAYLAISPSTKSRILNYRESEQTTQPKQHTERDDDDFDISISFYWCSDDSLLFPVAAGSVPLFLPLPSHSSSDDDVAPLISVSMRYVPIVNSDPLQALDALLPAARSHSIMRQMTLPQTSQVKTHIFTQNADTFEILSPTSYANKQTSESGNAAAAAAAAAAPGSDSTGKVIMSSSNKTSKKKAFRFSMNYADPSQNIMAYMSNNSASTNNSRSSGGSNRSSTNTRGSKGNGNKPSLSIMTEADSATSPLESLLSPTTGMPISSSAPANNVAYPFKRMSLAYDSQELLSILNGKELDLEEGDEGEQDDDSDLSEWEAELEAECDAEERSAVAHNGEKLLPTVQASKLNVPHKTAGHSRNASRSHIPSRPSSRLDVHDDSASKQHADAVTAEKVTARLSRAPSLNHSRTVSARGEAPATLSSSSSSSQAAVAAATEESQAKILQFVSGRMSMTLESKLHLAQMDS